MEKVYFDSVSTYNQLYGLPTKQPSSQPTSSFCWSICNGFYDRQFTTRHRTNVDVVRQFEDKMTATSVQFCLEDLMALLTLAHVKAEKSLVRKILKDYWKLLPASNALT